MIRKDGVLCVKAVTGNKKFLFQFKDGQNRDASSSLLLYVCLKYQVRLDVDETIFDLPKGGQVGLLIINRDPVVEGYGMFEEDNYLSIFYCLFLLRRYQHICQRNR